MARTTQKRKASSNRREESPAEDEGGGGGGESDHQSSPEQPSTKRSRPSRAAHEIAKAKVARVDSDDDIDSDDLPEHSDEEFVAEKVKKPRVSRKSNQADSTTANSDKHSKAKPKKATATATRGRKKVTNPTSSAVRGRGNAASKEDLPVKEDNTLFNSVKDPETALQSTAEDWIVKYHSDPGPALAELVNFIIRACGCNGTVDQDVAQDLDAIVDSLDDLQEDFKKEAIPSYPIVSRSKPYSKFRKSLSEFLDRLISSSSDAEVLYDGSMMETFKAWVSAMSSSSIRSFRHTATVIALWTITSISTVNEQAKKDLNSLIKQRDAEKKKSRVEKARIRELESKVTEARNNKNKLEGYLKDLIDSVFVHRYRDADAGIRSECVNELGIWMKRFPSAFLQGSYFRYLGWVLSDTDAGVRIAAIEAMAALYTGDSFAGQIKHFTDMFKGRLVEMANGDVDLRVRIATIGVLVSIDKHDLLEEEQRDSLAAHLFDVEPKVRKAVGAFVAGLLEEMVEEQKEEISTTVNANGAADSSSSTQKKKKGASSSNAIDENEISKLRLKCLASLLVKLESRVDKAAAEAEAEAAAASVSLQAGSDDGSETNATSLQRKLDDLSSVVDHDREGRIGMATEALWNSVEDLQQWQPCIELLLYDHSDGGSPPKSKSKSKRGQEIEIGSEQQQQQPPEEVYRLEPSEEAVLIETLIAILRTVRSNSENGALKAKDKSKDDDDDDEDDNEEGGIGSISDLTRALIPALPKLFSKYRTDSPRISEVLLIPQLMDLGIYLEMNDISSYELLWDDIIAQFVRHVEPVLLRHAVASMRCLNANTSLSNTNTSKLNFLEESLIHTLREITQGKDVETAGLDPDQIHDLGACILRLNYLFQVTDLSQTLQDDDNGQSTNAWQIILGLASRGNLGYREERQMIEDALKVLTLHLTWQTKTLVTTVAPAESLVEDLLEKRTTLLDLMLDFVGGGVSNVCTGVQRVAFDKLLHIYLMYNSISVADESIQTEGGGLEEYSTVKLPRNLRLKCEEETQFRCTGFVQAEMERYYDQVSSEKPVSPSEEKNGKEKGSDSDSDSDSNSDSGSDSDDQDDEDGLSNLNQLNKKQKQKNKNKKKKKTSKTKKSKRTAVSNGKSKHQVETGRPSRAFLEREVAFCSTISQFITAIRVGIIDFKHATGLLAQFGRLGTVFDACLKVLVEMLREQGVLNGRGDEVCSVILDSVQQSFEFYLDDGLSTSESNFVSLCRHLGAALVVRGAHLSILRTIPTAKVSHMHTSAVEYVVSKYSQAEQADDKSKKSKIPAFFKGLAHLLWATSPKESLKIKSAMDRAFADSDFEVGATAKSWEPQRSYEKRLLTIASKDKRLATGTAKAAAATPKEKRPSGPTERGEGDQEQDQDEAEAEAILGEDSSASAPIAAKTPTSRRPKPKPKATAAARAAAAAAEAEAEKSTSSRNQTGSSRKRRRGNSSDDESSQEEEEEEENEDLEIQSGAGDLDLDLDGNTDADQMDLEGRKMLDDEEEIDIFANLGVDEEEAEASASVAPPVSRKKSRKN